LAIRQTLVASTIWLFYTTGIQIQEGEFELNVYCCKLLSYCFLLSLFILLTACETVSVNNQPVSDEPEAQERPQFTIPELVEIPGGTFIMGDQVQAGDNDEVPVHNVTLKPFFISKYEISNKQYNAFLANTGHYSRSSTPAPDKADVNANKPATNVSWQDAMDYTRWLTVKSGQSFTLPSESEWEYVARAGAMTLYVNGNKDEQLCSYGNIADESVAMAMQDTQEQNTTACSDGSAGVNTIGRYRPNNFAVYDMHGNVWEWTRDCYKDSYQNAFNDGRAVDDASCIKRVIRGGSFQLPAKSARLSNREALNTGEKQTQVGFRIVLHP